MFDTANAEIRTDIPTREPRANYKELCGVTWNNLCEIVQVLHLICTHLEGDAPNIANQPEFKCYRDVLEANKNKSGEILRIVNELAGVLGCG